MTQFHFARMNRGKISFETSFVCASSGLGEGEFGQIGSHKNFISYLMMGFIGASIHETLVVILFLPRSIQA